MAFSDIVHARVENFFAFMKKRSLDLKGKQKLGKPPLGYTDPALKGQILDRMNHQPEGFSDLLKKKLVPGDVGGSTKIEDLVKTIRKKAKDDRETLAGYKKYISKEVTNRLRKAMGKVARVPPASIKLDDAISDHVISTGPLMTEVKKALFPILLIEMRKNDFEGSVKRAIRKLVLRCTIA